MNPGRSIRSAFSLALLAILVGTLVAILYEARDELEPMRNLGAIVLAELLLLRLAALGLLVAANLELLRRFTPRLSWREVAVLTGTGVLAGQFLPAGGSIAAKAVYLHHRHRLGYLEFAGVQAALLLVVLAASGMVAAVAAGLLWGLSDEPPPALWLILTLVLGGASLPFLLGRQLLDPLARRIRRLRPLALTWTRLTLEPRHLALVGALLGLRGLCTFAAMGLAFQVLESGDLRFLIGGTLEALTSVLQLVRITPGNLGLYEWCVSMLGHAYGTALTTGILAAALTRIAAIAAAASVSLPLLADQRTREILNTAYHSPDGDAGQSGR